MYKGAYVLGGALKYTFFNSSILVFLVIIFYVYLLIACKDKMMCIISVYMLLCSYVLITGMVAAHPSIFDLPELKQGMYLCVSVDIILMAFVMVLPNHGIDKDKTVYDLRKSKTILSKMDIKK